LRILVFTQYFTPEVGATSTRVHTFAAGLAARGHDVEVVAEVPNHPQGVVHPGFRGRILVRRRLDGFHGAWVWVKTKPDKRSRDRMAFYASYAATATAYGAAAARPDVVLASSPPLPVGAVAAAVARRHRVPWVLDVRDLWPAAAVALGELGEGRALRFAERLEAFLYRDAARVVAVTGPFRDHIAGFVGRERIELIPNGTTRFWLEAGAQARAESGADFTWAFAGNIGLAQGLDTAIAAAARLGDGFRLLIMGAGAARPALEAQAAATAPGRVEFRDQVPQAEAAPVLRAADALLVSLSPDPVLAAFVPSKLFDFCALGVPVIVAAAGEPQRLAAERDAALAVPPGDPDALAAAVRRLRDDATLRERLATAGRAFASEHLRERHVEQLEQLLARAAGVPSLS
jgi:glycosyltransferase involved in cell wall biosynthesis